MYTSVLFGDNAIFQYFYSQIETKMCEYCIVINCVLYCASLVPSIKKMCVKEKLNMKVDALRVWCYKDNQQEKYTQGREEKREDESVLRTSLKSWDSALPEGDMRGSLLALFSDRSFTDSNLPCDITHLFIAKFLLIAAKQQHILWQHCTIKPNP